MRPFLLDLTQVLFSLLGRSTICSMIVSVFAWFVFSFQRTISFGSLFEIQWRLTGSNR